MHPDLGELPDRIRRWAGELGFQQAGIGNIDLSQAEQRLHQWLGKGYHGEMRYMAHHGQKRSRPDQLLAGTRSIVSVRMDYLTPSAPMHGALTDRQRGYVSRYSLGRDYHKLMRKRLAQLARRISDWAGPFDHRVFVDSAPVLEKPLAEKAGLGWIGKHTNLINSRAGSWFFLGEIYTSLELPPDTAEPDHCGRCSACICPTAAIIAPYQLDARRCISYLTIELQGSIPAELRPLIGNRIYGCDDCQLVCPWNRFARYSDERDFLPRHGLDNALLTELFAWTEEEFLRRTEGSAIRRLGHERWLRNLAVALGNGPSSDRVRSLLQRQLHHPDERVREHCLWALDNLHKGA